MAEEYLGINTSTLNNIASAIKNKDGTNANLSFPEGMVQALQAIETEATVTPKIPSNNRVLDIYTPSFSIEQGFHSGLDQVSIDLETGSANPTDSAETYFPSSGKLFSSFSVGGIGSGDTKITGEISFTKQNKFTLSGFTFTPKGLIMALKTGNGSTSNFTYVNAIWINNNDFNNSLTVNKFYKGQSNGLQDVAYHNAAFGSIEFGFGTNSSGANQYWNGTYLYMVWGTPNV